MIYLFNLLPRVARDPRILRTVRQARSPCGRSSAVICVERTTRKSRKSSLFKQILIILTFTAAASSTGNRLLALALSHYCSLFLGGRRRCQALRRRRTTRNCVPLHRTSLGTFPRSTASAMLGRTVRAMRVLLPGHVQLLGTSRRGSNCTPVR